MLLVVVLVLHAVRMLRPQSDADGVEGKRDGTVGECPDCWWRMLVRIVGGVVCVFGSFVTSREYRRVVLCLFKI